jgi:hypothetical protein
LGGRSRHAAGRQQQDQEESIKPFHTHLHLF